MKLVYLFTVILALTLAEEYQQEVKEIQNIEKLGDVDLAPASTRYIPPSQRVRNWQTHQPIKAPNSWVPEVQNDYYSASQQSTTSTTPLPVIKNEFYLGDDGDYKYEYQIADGTSVGEQGYFTDPNKKEESIVKKGWYSFVGADGITYTVTYWADQTGYHAYGSHLPGGASGNEANAQQQGSNQYPSQTAAPTTLRPTNPSKPNYPAYTPPQQTYNPPQSTYKPEKPTYNPPQQTYNPPQQTYNPPQSTYKPEKPTYNLLQQTYNPSQQTYNPPQQTYNPPQQTYNPPQQTYNPPQQTYNPPQQTYNPPQQTYNPPQSTYNPPQQTYNPPQQTYNPPQQTYKPAKPTYNSPQQATYNQPQQQTYYPNYNV